MKKNYLDDEMKVLVAFYSRDGHTRRAAEIIGSVLKCDIDEIVDKKPRKGMVGFFRAGYDATREKTTEIKFTKNPRDYDIVVIGSPVWNSRVTPAVRTYILRNRENIKKAAFFVTCAKAAGKCLEQMQELYGEAMIEKTILREKVEEETKAFAEELRIYLTEGKH